MRKSFSVIRSAALLLALFASLPGRAAAQGLTLPLPGAAPLQQLVGNAVFTMCAKGLAPLQGKYSSTQEADLATQCTDIVDSAGLPGSMPFQIIAPGVQPALLGAVQQVSGNEISTQGALALRVGAGQFANISGRLDALRLGGNLSLSQNLAAFQDSAPPGPGTLVASAPQTFSLAIDPTVPAGGFAPHTAQPLSGRAADGLMYTSYFSDADGAVRTLRSDTSGGGGAGSGSVTGAVPNPWGLYVQGSYNSGHHDLTSNEDPFDFHAASVTAGLDYNFGAAVLGASIGYDDYDAGLRTAGLLVSGGSAQVQATSGSLYGAWFGQNWTFNGIATYGALTTDLTRVVKYDLTALCPPLTTCTGVDRTLKGSPDGRSFAVGATAGYQVYADSWDIVPSLSVNYRRVTVDSFTESDPDPNDGLALSFGDQTVESLRSVVALDLSRPVSVSFGVVTPIVRVEGDHEFKNGVRTIDAHYAFDPTANTTCLSCFALPTDAPVANYGTAAVGLSVTLARRVQAFVYDEALFGYSDYHSNAVTLGVRGQF